MKEGKHHYLVLKQYEVARVEGKKDLLIECDHDCCLFEVQR
jgi:hypothetical protein